MRPAATTADPDEAAGLSTAPIAATAVADLLAARPELTWRGARPDEAQVTAALESMWVPGEVVLYAGKAGTSICSRVKDYYRTQLGARSPHAGGWPLKTLVNLGDLQVHAAKCDDPRGVEATMLAAFMDAVSEEQSALLCDPAMPLPFANLEDRPGRAKTHGFLGACAPR